MKSETDIAWEGLAKHADFLERIIQMRNQELKQHANKDMIMSSIPIIGEAAQVVSDVKRYGPATAADRAAYIQYHPAHLAAGPVAAILGAASAPILAKNPAMRKLYGPVNKFLLGRGPHKMAPSIGIGLANTAAFGLLGNYASRGLLSRNYTLKEAAINFKIPDSAEEAEKKRIRTLTGISPLAPMLTSQAYALSAPIWDDVDVVKNLNYRDSLAAEKRMQQTLQDNKVVLTADRFREALYGKRNWADSLGLNFGDADSSKTIKKPSERLGFLMRRIQSSPGAYMDIDSPLSKALAANLYSGKEIKDMKGMILGGRSDSPLRSMFLGSSPTEKPPLHVIAHEMGHATQPQWMKSLPARAALKGAPMAAVAAPILSDNEQLGLTTAGLSTAAATPGLIGEFSASARGSKFLKEWLGKSNWNKMKPLAKLSPFVGIPTYLAAASLPWVAYGTKKHLGGYDKVDK